MVIFAIIIVVFAISFGAPMDGCQKTSGPQRAATVDGDAVMTDQVRIIYNRYGGGNNNLTEAQLAEEQSSALKALIIIHLLANEAEKIGLRAGDEELAEYVRDPLRNLELAGVLGGRTGIYTRYIVNQLRVSEKQYQEYKKTELLARKYLELAEMQVGVLPGEVEALQNLRETKVNLEYVKFNPATLKAHAEVSDADITAFLAANEAKAKTLYDERKEKEFSEPAAMRIRRIFITTSEDLSDDEKAAKQAKFEQAKKRILTDKEEFGKVAKELSEDFAKDKEGLMDWTPMGNIDENTVAALKDAKIGDVKEITTDFAFMLVKLEGQREAKITPFEEVKKDLAKELVQEEKVGALAQKMAEQLKAKVTETNDLKKAVDALKAEAAAAQAAEDAPADGETEVAANGKEGEEKKPEPKKTTPWDAVSVRDTGAFSLEGQDLSALFGGNLPPGVSLGVGDWDRIPGIGKSSKVALDAFKLTKEKPLSTEIYTVDGARVMIRLKERTDPPADEAKRAESQEKLHFELRNKRLGQLAQGSQSLFLRPTDSYGPWIDKMYEEAIKTNRITFNDRVDMAKILRDDSPLAGLSATGTKSDDKKADTTAADKKEEKAPAEKK
jgi:parvulin-like peptidyl-prolyl isomerase